ncbi:hypothetical protein GP2_012_00960 [Gordonia paraffinivorans NBRC 108238]|uniref:Uncharacterized protein n=1 Tax=Gordonia paraffinivorans NBRC 108238 TaxID=1223543 RepID=A0ABQ0IIS7_9ACTN|nr:hypothetical protein GP2_012_00960 [Gordonia paraffinivorans NBRC 108238]
MTHYTHTIRPGHQPISETEGLYLQKPIDTAVAGRVGYYTGSNPAVHTPSGFLRAEVVGARRDVAHVLTKNH